MCICLFYRWLCGQFKMLQVRYCLLALPHYCVPIGLVGCSYCVLFHVMNGRKEVKIYLSFLLKCALLDAVITGITF